jgi:hypothetical protein
MEYKMELLSFYIIFHKKLFPENIPNLPCFTYLGANENVKKEISSLNHPVVYEYDIDGYNPMYQMLQFCDNSIILNFPSPPTPFVGFCQYDMAINEDKFKLIFNHLDNHNKMVGFFPSNIIIIQDILKKEQWNQILNVYNSEHSTNHSIDNLSNIPFFLMNTYILPSWFYTKLQKQLRKFLPYILKFLNYNMRHIAGTLERTNALIIACALKEGALIAKINNAITDVRKQTLIDTLRH